MKNRNLNYALIIYIIFCLITVIGVLYGPFRFGHGLGDITMLFRMALSVLIVIILKSIKNLFGKNIMVTNLVLFLIIIFLIIYFTLCLTIFRGPESPW